MSGDWSSTSRVAPFGNHRITSCLQIPGAYRSLPRPSSPPKAKASSVRSYSLSLNESWWLLFDASSQMHQRLMIITRLPYEIAVPQLGTRKNSNFSVYRLLISNFSLPRYLSQYCQKNFVPIRYSRNGLQRYALFLNLQIFLEKTFKILLNHHFMQYLTTSALYIIQG